MATFGGFGGFGAPAASSSSGSLFGTSTPSFAGFGQTTTTKSVTFGQPATSTGFGGFGAPASSASTGFTGFGAPASTAATGFSFGAPASSAATGFGGFGAPASTASSGFSFGAPAAAPAFGTTPAAGAAPGGFSFATPAASAAPSFGGFGAAPAAGSAFSFKPATSAAPAFGGFGQPQQPAAAAAQPSADQLQTQALYTAMVNVTIFRDERDAVLAKWNQLQAKWGVGKGFYTTGQPVPLGPDNPFCVMKAVGYALLPTAKNDDGLVTLRLPKKEADVRSSEAQIKTTIATVLGNKPNVSVHVDSARAISTDKTEIQVYVEDNSGVARRAPATQLCEALRQPQAKQQIGAEEVFACVAPTAEQLQLYLDTPPAGIDKLIWEQAKKDNPDPKTMVPVPMMGFDELHRRTICQDQENSSQQRRLDLIASDISELQKTQAATAARISQLKRNHLELSHRILRVLVRQEVVRKQGWSIQTHEEQLRVKLEALQDELATPTQFKGRLNELLSQARLQSDQAAQRGERYALEPAGRDEIRQLLRSQQHGLQQLIAVVQTDLADLRTVQDGLQHGPRR